MLKSKTTRVAVVLTALAIMTSSLAVGTLAKYAIADQNGDAAHVAKFGVRVDVSATDALFADSYDDTVVTAIVDENKVAPGTAGSTTFTISGQPEVDVDVDVTLTDVSDVYLKTNGQQAGTYYRPVVFTLKQIANDIGTMDVTLATGNIADIQAYLDNYSTTDASNYEANANLASTYEISWEWVFDGNDLNDTKLGDLAAGLSDFDLAGLQEGTDYSLDLAFTLNVAVTQID